MRRLLILIAALLLSGCAAISGDKPFGEEKLSSEQASFAMEQLADSFGDMPQKYCLSCDRLTQSYEAFCGGYKTAYIENDDGCRLWLDGRLFYCDSEKRLFYRDIDERQLGAAAAAERVWQRVAAMTLSGEGEARLEYIPMAENHPYHLEIGFSAGEWEGCSLSAYMRADGGFDSVTVKYGGNSSDTVISAGFYFDEAANDIQAERRIWSFGNRCGAINEPVPALKKQKSDRQYCESIVASADFLSLAEYDESIEPMPCWEDII